MDFARIVVVWLETQLDDAFGSIEMGPFDGGGRVDIRIAGRVPDQGHTGLSAVSIFPIAPQLDAGPITIPGDVLKRSHEALEIAANMLAGSYNCKRWICSAIPEAALVTCTPQDLTSLDSTQGFQRKSKFLMPISLEFDLLANFTSLTDRMDGVEILAEALSNTNSVGRFRECWRLFERAFGLSGSSLAVPLGRYLGHWQALRFDSKEMAKWVNLRDLATHADRNPDFATESDVNPVLSRAEFATYDLLLNKLTWRSSDLTRRDQWRPSGAAGPDGFSCIVQAGVNVARKNPQVLDAFDAYPFQYGVSVAQHLPGCWFKGLERTGQVSGQAPVTVVADLRRS